MLAKIGYRLCPEDDLINNLLFQSQVYPQD